MKLLTNSQGTNRLVMYSDLSYYQCELKVVKFICLCLSFYVIIPSTRIKTKSNKYPASSYINAMNFVIPCMNMYVQCWTT